MVYLDESCTARIINSPWRVCLRRIVYSTSRAVKTERGDLDAALEADNGDRLRRRTLRKTNPIGPVKMRLPNCLENWLSCQAGSEDLDAALEADNGARLRRRTLRKTNPIGPVKMRLPNCLGNWLSCQAGSEDLDAALEADNGARLRRRTLQRTFPIGGGLDSHHFAFLQRA